MNNPLPTSPLSLGISDHGSRVGRFGGWRRIMAGVFDIEASVDEIAAFEGDIAAWSTARFVLVESSATSLKLVRSPQSTSGGSLDTFALQLLQEGNLAGLAGPTEFEAESGDIMIIDLSQTSALRVSGRGGVTAQITLWIPRSRLQAAVSDEHALHGLVLKGTSAAGELIGASLRALAKHVRSMSARELNALADGIVELTSHALAPTLEASIPSGAAVPLASFVTIRRYIDRNLASAALNADSIAKNFGLSRASLYRLFEPIGGIASYIRKARLNRAYQEITALEFSDWRIGQIVYGLGFKNVSAFNRAFREAYGMSPGEARKAARLGIATTQPLTSEAIGAGVLAQWLAQIGSA